MYKFEDKLFLQKAGGPIGLRSTCAVARVVMNTWDVKWKEKLDQNNITIKKGDRYMDDLRAFLSSIREGWRWHEGRLCYCEVWREEDAEAGLSVARRTGNILLSSMNEIYSFLKFTLELGEDFEDNLLPTLDTKIGKDEQTNTFFFEFFEKLMTTNMVVQADSSRSACPGRSVRE